MSSRTTRHHAPQASRLARCGLALAAGLWCWGGAARADELPRSPACRTALQALDRAEDALVTAAAAAAASAPTPLDRDRQHAAAARLQPLRERVGQACLGGLTTSPPPSQHNWAVPARMPSALAVPGPRMPTLPAAAAPPRTEVPVLVSNCNAATCLGSDGSTLTRVGPNLVGPRGVCTVQGNFLRCP
jgi:hypothetical protein